MQLGKVVGTVVASRKEEELEGLKLLVVQNFDHEHPQQVSGAPVVAVDAVGAGIGEVVLTCSGSAARQTEVTRNRPVDTVIMAIVDEIAVGGSTRYVKE